MQVREKQHALAGIYYRKSLILLEAGVGIEPAYTALQGKNTLWPPTA
jgi:hypothetical protein